MRPGEIYHLTNVPGYHGGAPKGRYVIIVTRSDDIGLDHPLYVVGCSASIRQAQIDAGETVPLPWSKQNVAATGFRRPTWAIPKWMLKVRPSQLGRCVGHVPSSKLDEIISKLPADPSADLTQ